MTFPEFCLKRPVTALVFNLIIILFGIIALLRLPVRELPDIDPPIITVTTLYPGANAELVERDVTERLEQEINNVSDIKTLTSQSRVGVSQIVVEFELNIDPDLAAQEVRDRVSRVRGLLPDDVEEPVISKQDADAQEVMWIALYSDRYSTMELTRLAERRLKDRLQTIPGVGGINLGGEKRPAIRIWLDDAKMASRGITPADIEATLQSENVELPSGSVENLQREMVILLQGRMDEPHLYEDLIIRYDNDTPVRIRDVARVALGVEDETTIARFNGKPAVGLGIVKQSDGNAVEVAQLVKKELKRLEAELPPDVQVNIPYDSSTYVEKAIHEVAETLFISFFLVVAIIFLFLRDPRSTLIPSLAVPVSIVGTFAALYLLDYSVNILTLLALVLAIGVVVDDSIVVLENIYRYIEEGMPPAEAAAKGMKEITGAVITITITLVAVFIPIAFQSSTTGILFREFAFTVAAAVIISAFVALSLAPVLAAHILKKPKGHGRIYNRLENIFNAMASAYARSLQWALKKKAVIVVLTLASVALTAFLYFQLPKEFLPDEDKGYIISVIFAPEGATSEFTDLAVRKAEAIVQSTPEVETFFSAVALAQGAPGQPNFGIMFARLIEERERSAQQILRPGAPGFLFMRLLGEVEQGQAIAFLPKAIDNGFGETYQLVLQAYDLKKLDETARNVRDLIARAGFLSQPRIDFNYEKPQITLTIDRNKAASAGVSVRALSETLQTYFGGKDVSEFTLDGKQYEVIAQLERTKRLTPHNLSGLYVRSRDGKLIQVSDLVTTTEQGAVNTIFHYQRFRSATISGQPQGITMGQAIEKTEQALQGAIPADVFISWNGEARTILEGTQDAWQILVLSLLIIYLVLAAQFESFVHPFTVMLAVPLAVLGAFLFLFVLGMMDGLSVAKFYAPPGAMPAFVEWLSRVLPEVPSMNLNLYSLIGLVLLLGLVVKNSILLVEFANQRVAQGLDATTAMIEAGRIRFRPILMTAISTIIGIMPIALGLGAGAESRRALGVAVVGGMCTSTLLTLFVVPVFYVIVDRLFHKKQPAPINPIS